MCGQAPPPPAPLRTLAAEESLSGEAEEGGCETDDGMEAGWSARWYPQNSGPSLWPGALYLLMSRIITYLHTLFITYTYSLSLYLASLPSLCLAGALYLLMSRVISHAGRGRDRGQKQERGETQPSECIGVLGSRVYGLWPRV